MAEQAKPNNNSDDPQFWQQHVEQHQMARCSKLAYCRTHALTYHRFLYWAGKFKKVAALNKPSSLFVPLELTQSNPFFNDLKNQADIQLSYCNAHARRKFEPIAKAAKTPGIADHAMKVYQALYRIEREAKYKKLTPSERYKLRLEKAKPIIREFKTWLDEIRPTPPPFQVPRHYVPT